MTERITIRHSTELDRASVLELAELDGRRAPSGDTLLAEVDGRLWAAVGVEDRQAVADPFEPAAEVVGLLRMRADQEHVMRDPGSLLGRLMAVRQRAGAVA